MRPVHFEYQTSDPAATMAFFSKVLGWDFEGWNDFPYWLTTTGPDDQPGINGAVMQTPDGQPRTVMIMEVPDISQALESVSAEGGEMVAPVQDIPGVGQSVYCRDPEGLLFGLFCPLTPESSEGA